MARKKKNNLMGWISYIVMAAIGLGIAGLFWTGTFLSVPVLDWLPNVVHQIVAGLVWAGIGFDFFGKITGNNKLRFM